MWLEIQRFVRLALPVGALLLVLCGQGLALPPGFTELTLWSPEVTDHELFGRAVASRGSELVVGAPGFRSSFFATLPGRVYVMDLSGAARIVIENPTADANDEFGAAVATVGTNIAVGAPSDDAVASDGGGRLPLRRRQRGAPAHVRRGGLGTELALRRRRRGARARRAGPLRERRPPVRRRHRSSGAALHGAWLRRWARARDHRRRRVERRLRRHHLPFGWRDRCRGADLRRSRTVARWRLRQLHRRRRRPHPGRRGGVQRNARVDVRLRCGDGCAARVHPGPRVRHHLQRWLRHVGGGGWRSAGRLRLERGALPRRSDP